MKQFNLIGVLAENERKPWKDLYRILGDFRVTRLQVYINVFYKVEPHIVQFIFMYVFMEDVKPVRVILRECLAFGEKDYKTRIDFAAD